MRRQAANFSPHMLPQPIPQVPTVHVDEVDGLLARGALLIDVREPREWDQARIRDSELRPMSSINDWYADLPRDRTIIVSCRSGQRSARVVQALIDQAGFDDVHNLAGGIIAWAEAGLDVET
jgi:rhodanese-related sulfurtransferase